MHMFNACLNKVLQVSLASKRRCREKNSTKKCDGRMYVQTRAKLNAPPHFVVGAKKQLFQRDIILHAFNRLIKVQTLLYLSGKW